MGTGIVKGLKKGAEVIGDGAKAVGKGAAKAAKAISPVNVAAKTIDKAVDRLKDDQFHLQGIITSEITLFGFPVGSIVSKADLVASVADKEQGDE